MIKEIKGIFHIHSRHSYDSLLDVKKILYSAKRKGYSFVIITDHNTLEGSLEAQNYANEIEVTVIPGVEYESERGDIIGIFINEEVKSKTAYEIIYEIKEQGGLVILPHPCKKDTWDKELIKKSDFIEVFNSRMTSSTNKSAEDMCRAYNKKRIVGSDAHLQNELFLTDITFKENANLKTLKDYFLTQDAVFRFNYSNKINLIKSQIIKAIKQKKFTLLLINVARFVKYSLQKHDYSRYRE